MGLVIVPWNRGHYILYICMIVFLRLVSTTFWAPVYQFLLHLIYHFGDQHFETMMITRFAIFLNSVGPLVWIMQVPFLRIRFSRNYKGATHFPAALDSYLSLELECGAVIGPFSSNPFSRLIVISPLNSVPKPQSFERRMILDLSWLLGRRSTILSLTGFIYHNRIPLFIQRLIQLSATAAYCSSVT